MQSMRMAVIYLAAGLIGGFALAALLGDDADGLDTRFTAQQAAAAPLERRVTDLELRLEAVIADNFVMAEELERLDIVVAEFPAAAAADSQARVARIDPEALPEDAIPAELRDRVRQRMGNRDRDLTARLTEAGFSQGEAERIETRIEELSVEAMQTRYEAMRSGDPQSALSQLRDSNAVLRAELGDADFERYLEATGRPTRVGVSSVLSSSAAEAAGIQPGDEILAYGGTRVFDVRELNQILLEGEPGEPVVVDLERNGQPIQIVMPRGPLGISSGFARRFNR